MARRVRIASRDELDSRKSIQLEDGDLTIAAFAVAGEYHALEGRCPHRGGPLGEGTLSGTTVICPWHRWRFDVTTGRCTSHPQRDVRHRPVTLQADDVWIEIE